MGRRAGIDNNITTFGRLDELKEKKRGSSRGEKTGQSAD